MDFISTKSILDSAVGRGVISRGEYQTFRSYLNTYDLFLDGKKDDGFFKGQFGTDTYVQIGHPAQNIREKVKKVNELALELLNGEKTEKKKTFAEAAKMAGIFGAKIIWAAVNPAACGGLDCGENCAIDLCYENDNGDIICGCPPGEEVTEDCHAERRCADTGPNGPDACWNETVCEKSCG